MTLAARQAEFARWCRDGGHGRTAPAGFAPHALAGFIEQLVLKRAGETHALLPLTAARLGRRFQAASIAHASTCVRSDGTPSAPSGESVAPTPARVHRQIDDAQAFARWLIRSGMLDAPGRDTLRYECGWLAARRPGWLPWGVRLGHHPQNGDRHPLLALWWRWGGGGRLRHVLLPWG